MSASSEGYSLSRQIRKLRKKIRQIEHLEILERKLDEAERLKVSRKVLFRDRLQDLLSQLPEDDGGHNSNSMYSGGDSLTSEDWSIVTESDEQLLLQHYEGEEEEESDANPEPETIQDETPKEEEKTRSPSPVKPQPTRVTTQNKTKSEPLRDPIHVMRKKWKNSFCFITELSDHSDIVNDLVVEGKLLITASRDTTVKVWDLEQGRQLRNLGGHTGSVTSVYLMSEQAAQNSGLLSNQPRHHRLVVSGSVDCSFKIWDSVTGSILKSVYTYNPITRVVCSQDGQVITGSDGGKIELWDTDSGENLFSTIAFEGAVTALKISDGHIYCASSTGTIKIFQIRDNSLSCMFESENLKSVAGVPVAPRFIRSLGVYKQTVFFGDDAINIKSLEWKNGTVRKLPNHTEEFASTDAICCFEDLLLTSSYDLDNGLGYVNIRSLLKGDYLATLDDEDTERIICLGCSRLKSGNLLIVTGGLQLKFWQIDETHRPTQEEQEESAIRFIPRLTRPGRDSDLESDTDLSDSDLDLDDSEVIVEGQGPSVHEEEQKASWLSYCAIL